MNGKRILKVALLVVAAIVLTIGGLVAWIFTSGMREPVAVPAPEYWPTDGWKIRSPEDLGFDSNKLAQGLLDIQQRDLAIDSLLIIRDGYVVLDAHFAPYDGTFPHDLASVTKSVMTTLIAMAADQGLLDLDQPVVSFFPERTIANLDERKSRLTVRHLAGMVNGMQSLCEEGDEATLDAMRSSADWVQAALDRPMVSEPGTQFCYDSPGMHLLSAILQQASGMTTLDFARQHLFAPLGISNVTWETDPQGYTRGWGDLHLLPEDAAKIGFLWLHRGNWEGQQLVPEAWVLASSRAQSKSVESDYGYGYGWWVSPVDVYASGRDGQNIRVNAAFNSIVVITGGGFEPSDIDGFLIPALLHLDNPRPADPEGQAALQAALATIQQDSAVSMSAISSQMAQDISGKSYQCENNLVNIESVRILFDDPEEATMFLEMGGVQTILPIGLDGSYHLASIGAGYRGWWEDENTFTFEAFDIGVLLRQVDFDGNSLQITLPEFEMTITCQVQGN